MVSPGYLLTYDAPSEDLPRHASSFEHRCEFAAFSLHSTNDLEGQMIAAMRLLWTFSFEPAKDELGEVIPLDTTRWKMVRLFCRTLAFLLSPLSKAFVEGPLPHECFIVPRSAERIADIERAFKIDAVPTLEAFEYRLDESDESWLMQIREGMQN